MVRQFKPVCNATEIPLSVEAFHTMTILLEFLAHMSICPCLLSCNMQDLVHLLVQGLLACSCNIDKPCMCSGCTWGKNFWRIMRPPYRSVLCTHEIILNVGLFLQIVLQNFYLIDFGNKLKALFAICSFGLVLTWYMEYISEYSDLHSTDMFLTWSSFKTTVCWYSPWAFGTKWLPYILKLKLQYNT